MGHLRTKTNGQRRFSNGDRGRLTGFHNSYASARKPGKSENGWTEKSQRRPRQNDRTAATYSLVGAIDTSIGTGDAVDGGRHLTTISDRRIPLETSRELLTVVAAAVAVVGGRREGEMGRRTPFIVRLPATARRGACDCRMTARSSDN